VFDVLNIFRSQWFLNWDHLIANVLSAQKSDEGCYVWVDFQPLFHTHLVQCAQALLPPLCPVAKGKKTMFVFILKVLNGDGPKPGSFWEVPKKCHHYSTLPKNPEVTPTAFEALVKTPIAPTLVEAPLLSTLLQQSDLDRNDPMTGVMPSALPDLHPSLLQLSTLSPLPLRPLAEAVHAIFPIPREFDCMRIVSWGEIMSSLQFSFNVATLEQLMALSGHTGMCATHVMEALLSAFSLTSR